MRNASDEAGPWAAPEPAQELFVADQPLSRARDADAWSASACEDAEALRAQSAHRQRPARENLAAARVAVGRVLVVDDSRLFREVARAVLSASTRLVPAGEAGSGEETMRLLPDVNPDLVLLDVHLPGLDGVETAAAVRRESPQTVVVLMSADSDGLEQARRSAHAAAVLDKRDLSPQKLDEIWLHHGFDRRG